MAGERLASLGKAELAARVRELEDQLESQETLQDLIHNLHVHQEELRSQHDALIETQHELEASRDRYAELYDFAPISILTLGRDGVIESMNLAAARMLGVERAATLGTPLLVFMHAESRRELLDHLVRARRAADQVSSELLIRTRDGRELPVEIQTKRFDSVTRGTTTFHSVLIDMTEHQRMVAARAASDAKDRFLAVLSHELRTPLTPILLTLETLGDGAEAFPAQRRALGVIRRNTEVMTRLIDDLLDVTRIVHDKLHLTLAPVALDGVLRSAVEMCESELEKHHILLDVDLRTEEAWVLGDALRLRQIFWNLLRNAMQHTPHRGRVGVRADWLGSKSLCIAVSDSGPGIEPEEMERLFEPFQQSAKQPGAGLGLGLTICRGLVEAHGGTIRVESEGADRGATFIVEIPSCPAPRSMPRGELVRPARHEPLRVLVVEDHADTADALKLVLTRMGYRVRVAPSLADARTLAQEPFDVLISDVQLPDGSGLDLMRELSSQHPVKGIAMSGYGTEADVQRSREAGFHSHLVKPVDVHRVADAIDALARY